jgi:cytochrome c oxidase cbb3-type subunit 3
MKAAQAVAALVLLSACGSGEISPGAPQARASAPPGRADSELTLGKRVYEARCYFCHGYAGNARTIAAAFLSPQPRDFTAPGASGLSRDRMLSAVRAGVAGTAMPGFSSVISPRETAAVVDFIRDQFMRRKARAGRYHTAANGWADHERYAAAYPFVRGSLPLEGPSNALTVEQTWGRRIFLSACVACHRRGDTSGPLWEAQAVSYPPNADACTACHRYSAKSRGDPSEAPRDVLSLRTSYRDGPYSRHDAAPRRAAMTPAELRGENLFQRNCAYCHAADGTGRGWIGTFLEPHPRDLTAPAFRQRVSKPRLVRAIREGIPGTAMPAWRSVLGEAEIDAVAAYVLRAFVTPPG